jgi:hypothetical protein
MTFQLLLIGWFARPFATVAGIRKSVSDLFTDGTLVYKNGTFLIAEDFEDIGADVPTIRAKNWGESDLQVSIGKLAQLCSR